jgi:hypothetical protein
MEELPDELKLELLLDVGYPGLCELCQVNQSFANICRDELLWRRLYKLDYPDWTKNEDSTWRESYLDLWHLYESIHQFAQQYLEMHLIIRPEYARIDQMIEDLYQLLVRFIFDHYNESTYTTEELIELGVQVAEIVVGLKKEYIGVNYRECDIRPFIRDADIELAMFLHRLGFINIDDVNVEEEENNDNEDEEVEGIEYHGD